MDKVFDPSIAFSGFIGAILITLLTSTLFTNNPFRIFIASEEMLFMSNWMKFVRRVYLAIIITLLVSAYSIAITSIDREYKYAWVYKFIVNYITPDRFFVIFIVLFFIMITLCFSKVQKLVTHFVFKQSNRRKVFIPLLLFLITALYSISLMLLYGSMVNEILIEGNNKNIEYEESARLLLKFYSYDKQDVNRIFLLTILNYLLLYPVTKLFKYANTSKILIDIHCNNGQIFKKKYLHGSNVDGFLLVSDSSNIFDTNKYLIDKKTITYIKFISKFYIFGKRNVGNRSSKIIMPSDFTEEEKKKFNCE